MVTFNNPCSYCYKNNVGYGKQYTHTQKNCNNRINDLFIKKYKEYSDQYTEKSKIQKKLRGTKSLNNKILCIPICYNTNNANNTNEQIININKIDNNKIYNI